MCASSAAPTGRAPQGLEGLAGLKSLSMNNVGLTSLEGFPPMPLLQELVRPPGALALRPGLPAPLRRRAPLPT